MEEMSKNLMLENKVSDVSRCMTGFQSADPFVLPRMIEYTVREAGKNLADLACCEACRTGNMEEMFRGIYQGNRLSAAYLCGLESGYDHGHYLQEAITAMACNDYELAEKLMPHSLGCTVRNYNKAAANLFMAIFYHDEKIAERALLEAEKYLAVKRKKFDRFLTEYLRALWLKEVDKVNELIKEMCKFEKTVNVFAHGLYALADYYLTEEEAERLRMPECKVFLPEYERYRRGNENEGKLLLRFCENVDFLNDMITMLPEVTLRKEGRHVYEDAQNFAYRLFNDLYRKGKFTNVYRGKDAAWAAKWDTKEEFFKLYKEGDEDKLYYDRGLLYYALCNPDQDTRYELSCFLLEKGAGVAAIQREFDGPFHYLLRQKEHNIAQTVDLCKKLLNAGADPNLAGGKNILPVECMMQMEYSEEELQPLYDFWLAVPDLDLTLRTFSGQRPIDIAVECHRDKLVKLLESKK